jgi:hypothetical protein
MPCVRWLAVRRPCDVCHADDLVFVSSQTPTLGLMKQGKLPAVSFFLLYLFWRRTGCFYVHHRLARTASSGDTCWLVQRKAVGITERWRLSHWIFGRYGNGELGGLGWRAGERRGGHKAGHPHRWSREWYRPRRSWGQRAQWTRALVYALPPSMDSAPIVKSKWCEHMGVMHHANENLPIW